MKITLNLHKVKSNFVRRLKKIEKGKFYNFINTEEMENYLDKFDNG